ncbi:hypothetical protein HanPSC8_Chr02g0063931 [Helianthus annuus]|nr:hypothetical protein HanPSC8_Chr02g0063931 [Helianthus annuus]
MALSLPLAAPAVHSPTTPLLRQRRTKTPSSSSMRPPATVVISSRRPAISSSDNHTPKTSILNPILVSFFRLERRIDQRERERERRKEVKDDDATEVHRRQFKAVPLLRRRQWKR